MQIRRDAVVTFEYVLKGDDGKELDSSEGDEPLAYLHGYEQIVPGLEEAMEGRTAGEVFDVSVPPELGYGDFDDEAIFEIPRDRLPRDIKPEVGMELASRTPDGHVIQFRITEVGFQTVKADANHPLAGQNLHFHVKIVGVRPATDEELDHGHVHGPGGHHHHHH